MSNRIAEIDREIARLHMQMDKLKNEKCRILERGNIDALKAKYGIECHIGMELLNNGIIDFAPHSVYLLGVYSDGTANIGGSSEYGVWEVSGITHEQIVTMRKAWLEAKT